MRQLIARAPTRIDFGGGWTDVPPYSEEQGGYVCNLAITRHCTVTITARSPDAAGPVEMPEVQADLTRAALRRAGAGGLAVSLHSHFPQGAGLGGSSAAGVATTGALAAWRGEVLERGALAEASRRLEVEDLGVAGGRQDHYAAAYGGALGLTFTAETLVCRIPLSNALRDDLARRCLVAYTGESRISGETITAVLDSYRRREPRVLAALSRMQALAREMTAALERNDLDALGILVGEHWIHQRSLHRGIPTPLIDAVLARSRDAGALGGKALGASGGGCVVIVAPDDGVDRVRQSIESLVDLLPFAVDETGFCVESHE
jgi:D-glycero-alpha-D-manno-heptose-7-phosphate kinase